MGKKSGKIWDLARGDLVWVLTPPITNVEFGVSPLTPLSVIFFFCDEGVGIPMCRFVPAEMGNGWEICKPWGLSLGMVE